MKIAFSNISIILLLAIFFLIPGTSADNMPSPNSSEPNVEAIQDVPGLFEICIVSPEMLETVRNNYGSKAIPLKVERGLFIGVLTPGTLYIRGDLNEEDFPVREIIHGNLEEKIGKHLIDITFGRDNAKTELFAKAPDCLIWVDTMYQKEDIEAIREYIDLINDLSQTTTFEDEEIALPSFKPNYNPIQYQFYKISIVDKEFFKKKLDDRDSASEQLLKDAKGRQAALVRKDHLFLLNDVARDERNHFLLAGILFSMGFHGESQASDSFFYPGNTKQTQLSDLDKKAIELMYGGRLQSGLDIEGIRKTLGIELKDE